LEDEEKAGFSSIREKEGATPQSLPWYAEKWRLGRSLGGGKMLFLTGGGEEGRRGGPFFVV